MPSALFSAKKIIDYQSDQSIGYKLRKKRSKRIIDLINGVYADKQGAEIVDVGGTREYWNIMPADYLRQKNVHITIVNIAAPDRPVDAKDPVFTYIQGDGCDLRDIQSNQFDIAHSNSVIEHVGGLNRMADFAKEIRRIAACYYVQTPNYYFPIEPHFLFPFFHWLPVPLRLRLVMRFQLGCFPRATSMNEARSFVDLCRLLKKETLRDLFPDAVLYSERLLLLVKSFVLIRNSIR